MGLFKKKNLEDSVSFRRKMAEKIANYKLRFAVERVDGQDIVISKQGVMLIRDGVFTVISGVEHGSKTLFRCNVDEMKASELLSLEGAIVEGPDLENGGKVRKLVLYYVYYA